MAHQKRSLQSRGKSGVGAVLTSLIGGVWLLIGAVVALNDGKWPAFMPPQLDLIAVPLSMISEKWGAYTGGAVAAFLGLALVAFGIFIGTKSDHA